MLCPFDPAHATWPTRTVRVARVVDLLAVTHAPERVLEFRRAMLAGELFPPISVVAFAGRFVIADGHKRFAACRGLALEEIPVEVWPARRLTADLSRQLVRFLHRAGGAGLQLVRGPSERREALHFLHTTWEHGLRIARSLRKLARS